MKLVTIVTPCYNEEKTIPIFLSTLDPILSSIEGYKFQYLFVNDGSKDKTLEVLEEAYSKRDDITIVNESRNFGQEPALFAGLKSAKGDYVICRDCDLQDNPAILPEICKKFTEGYDIVNPHRADRKKDSFLKRTTAARFYNFINKVEGREAFPKNVNLFRGLSRRAVDTILSLPESDRHLRVEYAYIGLKSVKIDFVRGKRSAGETKYNVQALFNHAFNQLSSGTSRPLFLPTLFGAFLTGFNLLGFITFLILFILQNCHVLFGGWITPLFLVFSIFLARSILIDFLAVARLYEHNILLNTRNRPTTIIDYVKRPEDKENRK